LTRGPIGRKAIEKVDRRLRDGAWFLSAIRDATAMLRTLDDLAERHDGLTTPEAFAEPRARIEAYRDETVRERLGEAESLADIYKCLRSAHRRVKKWNDSSERDLNFRRAYRQARDLWRDASDDPSPETLHEFRKRVKVLENQVAVVESDPAGPVARLQRLASLLADELGQIHDLDILREFLTNENETSPLLEPIDRRRSELRHDALRRAGVVFLDKPRVFGKLVKLGKNVETATVNA
jgi:CHAD domain-containing protein